MFQNLQKIRTVAPGAGGRFSGRLLAADDYMGGCGQPGVYGVA